MHKLFGGKKTERVNNFKSVQKNVFQYSRSPLSKTSFHSKVIQRKYLLNLKPQTHCVCVIGQLYISNNNNYYMSSVGTANYYSIRVHTYIVYTGRYFSCFFFYDPAIFSECSVVYISITGAIVNKLRPISPSIVLIDGSRMNLSEDSYCYYTFLVFENA